MRTALVLLLAVACGGDDTTPTDTTTGDTGTTTDGPQTKEERILARIADGNVDIGSGQSVYSGRCRGCHGTDGQGSNQGPALTDRLADATVEEVVQVVLDGGDGMRAYRDVLTNPEIADVTAFVFDAYGPE
ncbi:MAG: cytochrome c [Myxococcales bacterium]|nr:cytochrome c [Myxococcales bacterium]